MTRLASLGDFRDPGAQIPLHVERAKGVGLPFATLILSAVLSAAAFGIQMVQHSFEMRQANIENGFKFYFDNRTALKERFDADKEMSLLKLIGNAFPNVYCDVRQDVYERASAADIGIIPAVSGPAPFGEADRKNLVSFLAVHDRPSSPQFATGVISLIGAALASSGGADPAPCAPLTTNTLPTQTTLAADEAAPETNAPVTLPAPATAGKTEEQKQGARQDVDRSLNNAVPVYRVYFHIGVDGTRHARPLDIADAFRDDLANQQYRIMQGVQLVDTRILPDKPEVRYFGPEEQAAAEQLAQYLTEKFKSEKLEFTAKPIGDHFPYMNPDNIEVWLPDPRVQIQRKAPSKAAPTPASAG